MSRRARVLAGIVLGAGFCGCAAPQKVDLRSENDRLRRDIANKDQQLVSQQSQIDELNRKLIDARAIRPDDLERIFYPQSIVIDSLSGGEDYDGNPGDDGVTIYLRPIDRDGDTIKVAGDVTIQLFDLAAPGGPAAVGSCSFTAGEIGKHWHGKFLTNHYTLKCPWAGPPPANPELTLRVTFSDFLTQRVLTAQSIVKFKPAPAP